MRDELSIESTWRHRRFVQRTTNAMTRKASDKPKTSSLRNGLHLCRHRGPSNSRGNH